MATTKEYYEFIKEQLGGLEEVSFRAMMGEYVLYYKGKVVGGIYDDRLLFKPVNALKELLPNASTALPYPGAKEMLLFEEVDDKDLIKSAVLAVYNDLPQGRK